MIEAEQIAMSLDKHRCNGPGNFTACCPAHDDKNPSLAITDVDGTTLLYCFAGCSQSDVIEALRAKGLWPDEKKHDADNGPYFSKTDLLEMDFYVAIAEEEIKFRTLTDDENRKALACKAVLKSRGIVV